MNCTMWIFQIIICDFRVSSVILNSECNHTAQIALSDYP